MKYRFSSEKLALTALPDRVGSVAVAAHPLRGSTALSKDSVVKKKFSGPASSMALVLTVGVMLAIAAPDARAIDFQDVPGSAYANGETFASGGYTATVFAPTADFGLNGAIVANGSSCFVAACPITTSGTYYTAINDGGVSFAQSSGGAFFVTSFDAAFLPPVAIYAPEPVARITLNGLLASSQRYVSVSFDLAGTDAFGAYSFATYSLAGTGLADMALSSLSMNACLITTFGSCVWPADNQAQFALDNVTVTAVPEPQTWGLLGAGLFAIAAAARRRNRA